MPHDVYQVHRDERRDQDSVTSYALGTQQSLWPQICQSQFVEPHEVADENPVLFDSWEPNQSIGVSDSFTYLRDRLLAALAEYDFVINDPRQKLQVVVPERYQGQQVRKYQAAIQLLRSWRLGDEQEQRETLAYLKRALDEDRLSDRKLFP